MRRLVLLTLFGAITALAAVPAAGGIRPGDAHVADRDHAAELQRRLILFQSLPAARQDQVRALDRQLYELDPGIRERLTRVMARYADWLDRLSEEDRKLVVGEPTAEGRLMKVREIRQREWIERLPKAYREQLSATKNISDRVALIEQWKLEALERDEQWHIAALQQWNEVRQNRIPAPFLNDAFKRRLDRFVHNLELALSDDLRKRLKDTRALAEKGNWTLYARLLVTLSDRTRLLPATVPGPKTYDALPASVKKALPFGADTLPKPLEAASGRWPGFALAVVAHARANRIKLPEPLGPAKKNELPPDVRKVVDYLEKELHRLEAHDEMQRLQQAEGRWPEYPQEVMDLARQHKVPVPDWTLPLPPMNPNFWNQFRIRPGKLKQ